MRAGRDVVSAVSVGEGPNQIGYPYGAMTKNATTKPQRHARPVGPVHELPVCSRA